MRLLKEAGAGKATKRQRPQVAAHVKERLERYHRDCVVRETDNIEIDEKRPVRIKTKLGYKRWTAGTTLRTCWGATFIHPSCGPQAHHRQEEEETDQGNA